MFSRLNFWHLIGVGCIILSLVFGPFSANPHGPFAKAVPYLHHLAVVAFSIGAIGCFIWATIQNKR